MYAFEGIILTDLFIFGGGSQRNEVFKEMGNFILSFCQNLRQIMTSEVKKKSLYILLRMMKD